MRERIVARAVPLGWRDVDTDQIVPSTHLRRTTNEGWADALFANLRRDPGFILNDERFSAAEILLGGHNFGCGSSREHAVWALRDHGFEVVVASSFGDIFRNNCVKNGVVPAQVSGELLDVLLRLVRADPSTTIEVDLTSLELRIPGSGVEHEFQLDPVAQHMLLSGIDDIGLSLESEPALVAYESRQPRWLIPTAERST